MKKIECFKKGKIIPSTEGANSFSKTGSQGGAVTMPIRMEKVAKRIENFIKEKTKGLDGCVLGISGGIDSTVIAYLSVNALGKDKVHGVLMPYDKQNTEDAKLVAENLGINYEIINIKPVVKIFKKVAPHYFDTNLSEGNLRARIRMCFLYGCANTKRSLVLGTGNKSELMIGYLTKYGDGGVDIEPIGHLYKTEVWELAKHIKVPKKIIEKAPSAELWDGQTDENELGFDYYILDKILQGETNDVEGSLIEKVNKMVKNSAHKREVPPSLEAEDE